MKTFLALSANDRQEAFRAVQYDRGLEAGSVEKDFWGCRPLRELFTLPGLGEQLTFKGGTPLSKVWQLIERFSEDIDLIVDKTALGFGGDYAPEKAPSKKKRDGRLKDLKSTCSKWVKEVLQPALAARLTIVLGPGGWRLELV